MGVCRLDFFLKGAPIGQHRLFEQDRAAIGRSPEADIVITEDPGLSRLHFEVVSTARGFLARDLGSRNGLYVNGQRVTDAALQDGDRIRAGTTIFDVHLSDDDLRSMESTRVV